MDALRFKKLLAHAVPGIQLAQWEWEWRYFLEFVDSYFKTRNISNPIIVEIGIFLNAQKAFYEELLGVEHIGIDISADSRPDIVGDSHSLEKERLFALPDKAEDIFAYQSVFGSKPGKEG